MVDFLDFMDRFDGGGAGKKGDQFKGGGLLSLIGNALMRPAGYADRQSAMGSMRPQMRPPMQSPMQSPMQPPAPQQSPSAASGQSPLTMFGGQQPADYQSPSPLEMFGGQQPAQYQSPAPVYSGRGEGGMPYPQQQRPPMDSGGGQRPASYDGQFANTAPTFEEFVASLGAAGQNIAFNDLVEEYFFRLGDY